jgi:indolepyruvate ferredoxin oxidoreductase beta subunit
MKKTIHQQIVISGAGGQGVLFITRLLAEASILRQLPVFTSETHGMAQRGGTVISHLKIGGFTSPLIRPGQADGLLLLRPENLAVHGAYLKPGGWLVSNRKPAMSDVPLTAWVDADALARKWEIPKQRTSFSWGPPWPLFRISAPVSAPSGRSEMCWKPGLQTSLRC